MLSRKNHEEAGTNLPSEWIAQVLETLNKVYLKELSVRSKKFEAFGKTFPDEMLLIVSLLDQDTESSIPTTIMISVDLFSQKKIANTINNLIDSIGIFYDQYFNDESWNSYVLNWTESDYKNTTFYYKITRENMSLTLAADELLKQH